MRKYLVQSPTQGSIAAKVCWAAMHIVAGLELGLGGCFSDGERKTGLAYMFNIRGT